MKWRDPVMVVALASASWTAPGCNQAATSGVARPSAIAPSARGLYMAGEERYAAGDYASAVSLWRHSLLELSPKPSADGLRHKLILRMAHGQLAAFELTADRVHLTNAAGMLERYAARHENLFGEGKKAKAERGDVYEILYQVELRLDATEVDESGEDEAEQPALAVNEAGENSPADATDAIDASDTTPPDTHEGEVLEDEMTRSVVVDTKNRPSVEDPVIRARLAGAFSTGWGSSVLTAPGYALVHGPRPLVRMVGAPKVVGETESRGAARRSGWQLVRAARPRLEDCFAQAFARHPVPVADVNVQVNVAANGEISGIRIQDGSLVDAFGDACLRDALDIVQVVPEDGASLARVDLPLRFFYQGAGGFSEMFTNAPFERRDPATGGMPGLPATDQFNY